MFMDRAADAGHLDVSVENAENKKQGGEKRSWPAFARQNKKRTRLHDQHTVVGKVGAWGGTLYLSVQSGELHARHVEARHWAPGGEVEDLCAQSVASVVLSQSDNNVSQLAQIGSAPV